MAKILVVEDDLETAELICTQLTHDNHLVESCHNGEQAMEYLRWYHYDVIVLDWNLPELNGLKVCSFFRTEGGQTPVLMLSAYDAIDDKEMGFDSGVDDYLTKPFHMKELSARVRALARRATTPRLSEVLEIGPLWMDTTNRIVKHQRREIKLAGREFALLEFLMRHPGQVFTADVLIDRIWGCTDEGDEQSLRTCIKRIRQKLGESRENSLIQSVYAVGYALSTWRRAADAA